MATATTPRSVPKSLADGEGEVRWFLANLVTIKLTGDETGGHFSLIEMVGPKGDIAPLHVHRSDDETFLVLEGELTLFVGRQIVRGGPGSVFFAPKGIPHTYRIESETAKWRVISSPSVFAEFVAQASVPAAAATLPPGPPEGDPERLTAIAAEYGIEILGPPGTLPST